MLYDNLPPEIQQRLLRRYPPLQQWLNSGILPTREAYIQLLGLEEPLDPEEEAMLPPELQRERDPESPATALEEFASLP